MSGAEIRAARKRRGWTQADLAARVGWSQATISLIERGKVEPSPELAPLLEALLREDSAAREGAPGMARAAPLSLPDLTTPARALSLPVAFETWKRPQESGDLCLLFPFPGDTLLVVALDVAGHGAGVAPLGVYVAGWLRGWLGGMNAPPRLPAIAAELSRELRRTGVDLGCYLGLFSRDGTAPHTVTCETLCHGFPPPLLLTGPPFRTEPAPQVGPPLPADVEAPVVRLAKLSAPWRLVVATDGLLNRLGNGDEMLGKQWLREWQTGPDREGAPADHLDPRAVLGDDEFFACLSWNGWDVESTFSIRDDAQRHQTLELIGQNVEKAVGRERHHAFEQALAEALDNVRKHAYNNGPGLVTVRFRQEEEALRAEVEDQSPLRAAPNKVRSSTGGLAVMRSMVDGVDLRTRRGGGWIVQLRIARAPRIRPILE